MINLRVIYSGGPLKKTCSTHLKCADASENCLLIETYIVVSCSLNNSLFYRKLIEFFEKFSFPDKRGTKEQADQPWKGPNMKARTFVWTSWAPLFKKPWNWSRKSGNDYWHSRNTKPSSKTFWIFLCRWCWSSYWPNPLNCFR